MPSPFRIVISLTLSLIFLNTFTIDAAYASPDKVSGDSRASLSLKRLVVLDFKLTGDVGGSRFEAEHKQRLRMASEKLRDELKCNQLYNVVDDASASAIIERWSSEQNLHQCNDCELDMAKQLNAEQVLVPSVFRMSNLVLYNNARGAP